MLKFQAYYRHDRPHRRTSPSLEGTCHDNCPAMDVMTRGRRVVKEEFYCNRQCRYIEPTWPCRFEEG